jgi:hypothetical protein
MKKVDNWGDINIGCLISMQTSHLSTVQCQEGVSL